MLDLRLAVDESAYGTSAIKIRCLNPAHDDPIASMAVYPDNLHCHGCGFHRNDWDEALALLLGTTKAEARERAKFYDSEHLDAYRIKAAQQARRDPLPLALARMYNRHLHECMPQRLDWFLARGLTQETVDKHLLGHDGMRFTIPIYDAEHQLLTIRFRKDDTILPDFYQEDERRVYVPKYSGMKGRNGLYLFGEHWLGEFEDSYVIVTEGELDALLLYQLGYPAVSATNGARQARNLPAMIREVCPRITSVLIATDQDRGGEPGVKKGEEAAREVAVAATALDMSAYRLAWLEGKDISEHYVRAGKLDFIRGRWNGKRFVF